MDVPTALQAVFVNARRQPGQEKPDALHNEGNDKRVLYKLKDGNLQIVFADGKWVREIQMEYAKPLMQEDLKLLDTSNTFGNAGGETRHDDRYSVGFTARRQEGTLLVARRKDRRWLSHTHRLRLGEATKGGLSSKETSSARPRQRRPETRTSCQGRGSRLNIFRRLLDVARN